MIFNYVLFGIYLLALLFLVGFLVIFIIHIRGYLQYSKYISGVLRTYIVVILIIALFGGYKILLGTSPSLSEDTTTQEKAFF